jgi:hypothetical protein
VTATWLRRVGLVSLGWLQEFGRFCYRFIMGDDWHVAAIVAFALVETWLLRTSDISAWWLLPLAAVAATGMSLRRARQ